MHSMTGFGRADGNKAGFHLQVELSSLNNRFLEISLKLPRQLFPFQHQLRELLKKELYRGKLSVFMSLQRGEDAPLQVDLDMSLAAAYRRAAAELAKTLDLPDNLGTYELMQFEGVLSSQDSTNTDEELYALMQDVLGEALTAFKAARAREGEVMRRDLLDRLSLIESTFGEITAAWESNRPLRRQQLQEKLGKLIEGSELKPERFEMEVAILLDKQDISEEITRFRSHVELFRQTMDGDGAIGSKLNFILQEMIREANTVSSKSPDTGITHLVLVIKEEVERIREQVQNIE